MATKRLLHLDRARYMTPKEGAFMVGVSLTKLRVMIRNGGPNAPPFLKRGSRYLLPREEFTKWAMQDVID
jgi:excisionase family DNA binding protein